MEPSVKTPLPCIFEILRVEWRNPTLCGLVSRARKWKYCRVSKSMRINMKKKIKGGNNSICKFKIEIVFVLYIKIPFGNDNVQIVNYCKHIRTQNSAMNKETECLIIRFPFPTLLYLSWFIQFEIKI